MATQAEQLILRGLHLLMRVTFSPNDAERAAKHMVSIQQDIGPWFSDYVEEMKKPTFDEGVLLRTNGFDSGEGGGGIPS
jgi:hypothetical protein